MRTYYARQESALRAKARKSKGAASTVAGLVDPLQLWGSLTQQFQHIAANALKDASTKTAADMTKNVATGMAKEALKNVAGQSNVVRQKALENLLDELGVVLK